MPQPVRAESQCQLNPPAQQRGTEGAGSAGAAGLGVRFPEQGILSAITTFCTLKTSEWNPKEEKKSLYQISY